MGDGVANNQKGRIIELYQRIKDNDPANSAFVVVLGTGSVSDADLRDLFTLQQVLNLPDFGEATFTNYVRKTVTEADLVVLPDPDQANDRFDVDMPDLIWTSAGGAVNDTLTRLLLCYDPDTTSSEDGDRRLCCFYDFNITTDGSDLTAQINASGFLRAS